MDLKMRKKANQINKLNQTKSIYIFSSETFFPEFLDFDTLSYNDNNIKLMFSAFRKYPT